MSLRDHLDFLRQHFPDLIGPSADNHREHSTTATTAAANDAPATKPTASPAQGKATAPTSHNHSSGLGASPSNGDAAQLRDVSSDGDGPVSDAIMFSAVVAASVITLYRGARAWGQYLCHLAHATASWAKFGARCCFAAALVCSYAWLSTVVDTPTALVVSIIALVTAKVARDWLFKKIREKFLIFVLLSIIFMLFILSSAYLYVSSPGDVSHPNHPKTTNHGQGTLPPPASTTRASVEQSPSTVTNKPEPKQDTATKPGQLVVYARAPLPHGSYSRVGVQDVADCVLNPNLFFRFL